jgi:hypothetical protein
MVEWKIAGQGECKGPMKSISATVCMEGSNFERGKMNDGAAFGTRIVAAVRSSSNYGAGAPGPCKVGTRVSRAYGITYQRCKVDWEDQMVDEASQLASGLRTAFDVSHDRNTKTPYFFAISVKPGSATW